MQRLHVHLLRTNQCPRPVKVTDEEDPGSDGFISLKILFRFLNISLIHRL